MGNKRKSLNKKRTGGNENGKQIFEDRRACSKNRF